MPASAERVAQAGNGNSTSTGTGRRGWETYMEPGLRMVLRCRWAPGSQPYCSRPASAESSRPTTRTALLATTRRSTSLAVCWAPISTMPRLRPRSATSRRISLIGLDPSRGAYLFSSSSTTNCRGLATPEASLRSNAWRSTTPTTKRCARSCRAWMSTTVTWCDSRSSE